MVHQALQSAPHALYPSDISAVPCSPKIRVQRRPTADYTSFLLSPTPTSSSLNVPSSTSRPSTVKHTHNASQAQSLSLSDPVVSSSPRPSTTSPYPSSISTSPPITLLNIIRSTTLHQHPRPSPSPHTPRSPARPPPIVIVIVERGRRCLSIRLLLRRHRLSSLRRDPRQRTLEGCERTRIPFRRDMFRDGEDASGGWVG